MRKKLTDKFEEILKEYKHALNEEDPTAGGWAIQALIDAVQERDAEIIGTNDGQMGRFSPTDWYDIRNQLRAEQKKKAEETL